MAWMKAESGWLTIALTCGGRAGCARCACSAHAVAVQRACGVRGGCGGDHHLSARQPQVVHLEQVGEGRAGRARAAHAWLGLGLGLGLELWGRVRGSGIKDIDRTAHGRLHARGPMRIVRAGHPGRDVLDVVVDQIDELREAA